MRDRLKKVRLELHDDSINAHRYYEVFLDQVGEERFSISAQWGRVRGTYNGRHHNGSKQSQPKEVVGDVISAMVEFQNWVIAKEKKGYELVSGGL